jgi:aminopeptidase
MISQFYEKMANLAVNYSIKVKKGDRILIMGPALAKELFQAVNIEILKAGGFPLNIVDIEGMEEILYKYGSEEQLQYIDDTIITIFKTFNGMVNIIGEYNTRKLSLVDPKLKAISKSSPKRRELMNAYMSRMASGEFPWVIIPYPCNSFAQEGNMDLFSYGDFIKKALLLDKENPVAEWEKIFREQEKVIAKLSEFKPGEIHVLGEDTDLKLSVKGRKWLNSCGHYNLPDGEIYTGPVEESINGKIRFTYPGIFQGQEIEDIYLEFENGKVTKATATKGEDLLKEILKIEGTNMVGEFAIGTNYGITNFTKNILFDEKMGGTIHMALGSGIKEAGSKNESAVHWDILKDMRFLGSKITIDGTTVYEEGQWKI